MAVDMAMSARFATLMRELAAEHTLQVAQLRRQLDEALAAAGQQCVPEELDHSNGNEPTAPRGQHSLDRVGCRAPDAELFRVPEDNAKEVDPRQCQFPGGQDRRGPGWYNDASSEACSHLYLPSEGKVVVAADALAASQHENPAKDFGALLGDAPVTAALIPDTASEDSVEQQGSEQESPSPEGDEVNGRPSVAGSDSIASHVTTASVLSLTKFALHTISLKFDMIIGACIVANALVMAMEIEYYGRKFEKTEISDCDGECGTVGLMESFFYVMTHIFCAIFLLELLVRLKCEGFRYLGNISNLLDAMIVVVSVIDSWVLDPLGDDSMGNIAILRLMRLFRLAKVLRVVRVMKAFESLRVLVGAVANSVGALGWSMTLLFVLELIGAIFIAQMTLPFMEDTDDPDLRDFMFTHFGTWTSAMLTIFEVTMAPGGFIQYRRLYEEVHPMFGIFFMVYVCIVTFAVVRVITALFLKATLAASASDELILAQERVRQHIDYVEGLKAFCAAETQIPAEEIPRITRARLRHLLREKHFKDWMKEVNLDGAIVRRVHCILEQSGKGKVNFDDWSDAILQLARPPQHVETVAGLLQIRGIFRRILRVEHILNEQFRSSRRMSRADSVPDSQFVQSRSSRHSGDVIDPLLSPPNGVEQPVFAAVQ